MAQEMPAAWQQWIDLMQEEGDNEIDINEIAELYEDLSDNPININDTTSDILAHLPFVGALRWNIIKAYIEQHGQLFSINELYLLNRFDRQTVDMLRPIITIEPYKPAEPLTRRQLLTKGRHKVVVGADATLERAAGYTNGIYEGSPLHLYALYKYHYGDKVDLTLSADKDAGEALFAKSQPQGADFYGGHLMVSNIGILRRGIVGQYNLQFGQGLTLWSGFASHFTLQADISRYARGIVAASPFVEYGYMRGIATTLALSRHIELSSFYSNVLRDATADQDGIIHSITNNSLHRSTTEINNKDRLREQLYGAHLRYTTGKIDLGATVCHTVLSDSIIPHSYKYNYHAFTGRSILNAGIDARLVIHRLLIYGEGSISSNGALAGIAGASLSLAPTHQIGLTIRHYDADYHNLHCSPIARSSTIGGEQGIRLAYEIVLPLNINATAEVDAFRFSTLHYQIYAPSRAVSYRVALARPMSEHTTLTITYFHRQSNRNHSGEGHEYLVMPTLRQQLTADFRYEDDRWMLRTHASLCLYDDSYDKPQAGFAIYQDFRYSASSFPLTITLRGQLFHATDYNTRLYATESDLAYLSTTASLYGKGFHAYLIARYAITPQLLITAKYSIIAYNDRETIGSQQEAIDANHRQLLKAQLVWKF